jgi:hypothetical protein
MTIVTTKTMKNKVRYLKSFCNNGVKNSLSSLLALAVAIFLRKIIQLVKLSESKTDGCHSSLLSSGETLF